MTLLREKADQFVYLKLGEKPTVDNVHKFLGKSIPVCALTGATVDVVGFPVDLNVENILPSNMAYVSKSYTKGDPLSFAMNFSTVKVGDVEVTLMAPAFWMKKMVALTEELLIKLDESKELKFQDLNDDVYATWDYLMFHHLKGMNKVTIFHGNKTCSIEAPLASVYFAQKIKSRMEAMAPLMK